MLLDSAKPPTYRWDWPWGAGMNDPRGTLEGEIAGRTRVEQTLFPFSTDLVPSYLLAKGDATWFPGEGTGAEG